MIVLNRLTKNETCESVDILVGEKGLITIEYGGTYYDGNTEITSDSELLVINHRAEKTYFCKLMGVIDSGVEYNFQAYNNRIKVIRKGEKPYRGIK